MPGDFFEVRVEGTQLVVRFGPRDRIVSERIRPQASELAANSEMERLISTHLEREYSEVFPDQVVPRTAVVHTAALDELDRKELRDLAKARALAADLERQRARATIASEPSLEAECRAARTDPAPWAVYADWLMQQGDPRGEIAASLNGGQPSLAKQVFELHQAKLCGFAEPAIDLQYRHGFAIGATIPNPGDASWKLHQVVAALLASPVGTFLEELRCGLTESGSGAELGWRPTLETIVESHGDQLRVLHLDRYTYDDTMMHWVDMGDWSGLLDHLPALEDLRVRGDQVAYGSIDLPSLRSFVRQSCTMRNEELAQLARARWPSLDHLELWFGSAEYGVDPEVEHIRPLLVGKNMPRLRHLGLVNCDAHMTLLPELARSQVLPRLDSLDLSKGTFGHDETAFLVEHAPSFRHLASIDLEDNFLDASDIARLRGVLDNVIVTSQRIDDEDAGHRYVVEYE